MLTTSELLLLADQERARTNQVEPGMSDLGSCRRRFGYKLALTPHVNRRGSIQAAVGSAIHDLIALVLLKYVKDGDLIEFTVEYAGLKGTLDRYFREEKRVVDTKTTSARWAEHIKLHGPDHSHVWQVACPAAGLLKIGMPVETVAIEYLVRDSGREFIVEKPFDVQDVRDALEWAQSIRDTPVDDLPRDYEPDSEMCLGCPYGGVDGGICWEGHVTGKDLRTVLYAELPDGEYWSDLLFEKRQEAREATTAAKRAAAALTAVVNEGGVPTKVGNRWLRIDGNGALRFVPPPED